MGKFPPCLNEQVLEAFFFLSQQLLRSIIPCKVGRQQKNRAEVLRTSYRGGSHHQNMNTLFLSKLSAPVHRAHSGTSYCRYVSGFIWEKQQKDSLFPHAVRDLLKTVIIYRAGNCGKLGLGGRGSSACLAQPDI